MVGKIDVTKFQKYRKGKDIFIIDTNVFVDCPDIINKINKECPIILSAKVLDELDKLKSTLNSDKKFKVQKALKSINQNMNNRDIRLEEADLSLIPVDYNNKISDNLIFSVILKFKNKNPILLTSDNGLQIKAKGSGIRTLTLREFLIK